jgi:hypothetical protein
VGCSSRSCIDRAAPIGSAIKKKPTRPRSHRDGDRLVFGILLILPPSLAWALGRGACLAPSGARHRALVCSDRYCAESVWPLVPTPDHEVLTQFKLVKKRKSVKKTGGREQYTPHPIQKKRNHTSTSPRPATTHFWVFSLPPYRLAIVSLPYMSRGRAFSAATWFRSVSLPRCPHSVTPAYFESFSYSLSAASC